MSPGPQTLIQHVCLHASRRPQSCALRGPEGTLDYASLERTARGLAGGFLNLGIKRGDVIAAQLPNSREFVLALLAANLIGAVLQTVHMPYRRAELAPLLAHSGARAYIGLSRFKDTSPAGTALEVQATDLPQLVHVIAVGEPVQGCADWAGLCAHTPLADPPIADPDAPYVLLYTSGTTASPKGVPTTARRFVTNAADAAHEFEFGPDDTILSAAPFSHLYGFFVLQAALVTGASVSLLPAFTPADLITCVRRDQPSAIFAGPAHFKPLLDRQVMERTDFACTRLVCLSGTTVAPALARAVEGCLDAGVVIQLWGMTELQAGTYGRPHDPPSLRHETAGRAAPGMALRVVNEAGHPVVPGMEGRLQVKGRSLFTGYLNNPTATQEAFTGDWFDTGDTALVREDGALVLTGRVKELINRGGVKFNPVDVEAILDTVPGVSRCVLAPMADPVLGERACAFVQTDGSAEVTLNALLTALDRAAVAKFKWPERLEFVAEFPVTPTQKVRRAVLSAQLAQSDSKGRIQ